MSAHDTLAPGRVIIFGDWTGSEYIEYQAYVRALVGNPELHQHIEVNLTYSSGGGAATPANAVLNIEQLTGDTDYWRWLHQPNINDSIPRTITRPLKGQIVWAGIYDAPSDDTFNVLAFVRSIPGPPSEPEPNLNISFYDPRIEDSEIANNVAPFDGTSGANYWHDQK